MNAPNHSTPRINATPRGDNNPRGPALVRYERRLWPAVVGWMLVLSALALTVWARFQPIEEIGAARWALAAVVLAMMAAGVAMAGKEVR